MFRQEQSKERSWRFTRLCSAEPKRTPGGFTVIGSSRAEMSWLKQYKRKMLVLLMKVGVRKLMKTIRFWDLTIKREFGWLRRKSVIEPSYREPKCRLSSLHSSRTIVTQMIYWEHFCIWFCSIRLLPLPFPWQPLLNTEKVSKFWLKVVLHSSVVSSNILQTAKVYEHLISSFGFRIQSFIFSQSTKLNTSIVI